MLIIKNKLYQVFVLFFVFTFMLACKDGKDNLVNMPDNLIAPEKMQKIISELHMIDGLINQQGFAADSAKKIAVEYYAFVYKKYAVNELDFNSSFKYYISNPKDMDSIYIKVIEQLNMEEIKLKTGYIDTNKIIEKVMVDTSKKNVVSVNPIR